MVLFVGNSRTKPLLNRAAWDTFAAMGAVRCFVVARLDEAARIAGGRRHRRNRAGQVR
jgi:hypothetical protein